MLAGAEFAGAKLAAVLAGAALDVVVVGAHAGAAVVGVIVTTLAGAVTMTVCGALPHPVAVSAAAVTPSTPAAASSRVFAVFSTPRYFLPHASHTTTRGRCLRKPVE